MNFGCKSVVIKDFLFCTQFRLEIIWCHSEKIYSHFTIYGNFVFN